MSVIFQPDVKRTIDFLLIGAQKSGTTSLWKHIAAHPEIFVPATKEVEFFSDPRRFERGVEWYWDVFFSDAPESACKGEATTQYMMFPEVPARIRDAFPDVKLLALLRNPIDRAYSHYRMSVMRGYETRSFEDCVDALLARPEDEAPDIHGDYLRFGEYGRILGGYLRHFDAERLCVVFTETLEADPGRLTSSVYEFLGVDSSFRPRNLSKRFNVSGDRVPPTVGKSLRRAVGRARRLPLLDRLISQDRYEAFKFWTRTELNVRGRRDPGPGPTSRARLADFFAPDVQKLRHQLSIETPWPELV
jgi:LPS sulfotransferase NodH